MPRTLLLDAGTGLALLAGAIALLYLAKLLFEWALQRDVDEALFTADNPAIGLTPAGHYAGVALVLAAALGGEPGPTRMATLGQSLAYALWGLVLLAAAMRSAPRVLFPRLELDLLGDRLAGAGLVYGAGGLASGAVVAAAMQGQAPGGLAGGLASMTGAFLLGQLSLALLARGHRLVAHFDVHAEIRHGNTAAACTLAGALLGDAVLLYWGFRGDLVLERPLATLAPAAAAFVLGLLLLPAVRLLVSRLFFAGIGFDREIAGDKNLAAGVLELVAHPTLALLVVSVLP